jgi:putative sigma-54 modulation protein
MQVIVKSRHTKVPESLKQMAIKKVERVRRFFDRILKLEIEFSEEHNPRVARRKHTVEVTLSTKNHLLRAKASGADPAAAVDAVVDKLEVQVKRLKDKLKRKPKSGKGETIRVPARTNNSVRAGRSGPANSIQSAGTRRAAPRVRRTGRFSVEPMTPSEAALEMTEAGEAFMAFVNAETEQVSVVYRMEDGSFGLVEPAEVRTRTQRA